MSMREREEPVLIPSILSEQLEGWNYHLLRWGKLSRTVFVKDDQ